MLNKANRGTGAGGANTNKNGINFEQKTYLGDWIEQKGYKLEPIGKSTSRTQLFKIYNQKDILIGYYGRQSRIYEALELVVPSVTKEKIDKIFSKRIFPDAFIINVKTKKLIIFEKKWQQSSGSVDEKIQTAPFKIEMFEKLLGGKHLQVMYQYILSSWFKNPSYRNLKEYYSKNNKVEIWIEQENLNQFSIEKYIKYKEKCETN